VRQGLIIYHVKQTRWGLRNPQRVPQFIPIWRRYREDGKGKMVARIAQTFSVLKWQQKASLTAVCACAEPFKHPA
jgi:hypothetical protein